LEENVYVVTILTGYSCPGENEQCHSRPLCWFVSSWNTGIRKGARQLGAGWQKALLGCRRPQWSPEEERWCDGSADRHGLSSTRHGWREPLSPERWVSTQELVVQEEWHF